MKSKILLAEDDKDVSSSIKYLLTKEGYETEVVKNGNDAFGLLSSFGKNNSNFDLFLTDYKLPGITGLEVIDKLHEKNIIIPTILISGYADKNLMLELLKRKFTNFLEKPFESHNLISLIEELVLTKDKLINNYRFILSKKLEMIGLMSVETIHSLNNYLTVIFGNLDLIQKDIKVEKKFQLQLDQITKDMERVKSLILNLFKFTSKSNGISKKASLEDVIKDIVRLVSSIYKNSIIFKIDIISPYGGYLVDEDQIQILLMNLIINSIQEMKSAGTISILVNGVDLKNIQIHSGTEISGKYIQLTIGDTGKGIEKEIMGKIFHPFFTTKKEKGTGLGLSTVLGIMNDINGYIVIESEKNVGTKMKMLFPLINILGKNKGGNDNLQNHWR